MTLETYRELFSYMAFPVFVTTRDAKKIIYKNLACEQQFPDLARKNLPKLLVFQDFHKAGAIKICGFGVYHTAVVFENVDHFVFLFLSHLQYEMGLYHANQLFCKYGPSLTDFLFAVHNGTNREKLKSGTLAQRSKLYTETVELLLDERDLGFPLNLPLYQVAVRVFEKLNAAFSDFGYRVNTKMADDFPRYLQISSPMQFILFALGRLLYLQMKLSKTKEVDVLLSCDLARSEYVFHITAKTDLSEIPEDPDEVWFWNFVPECAMEFALLKKSAFLNRENFKMKLDCLGNLTLLYSVPYISPETHYVRSMDADGIYLLLALENMLSSLRAKLTDTASSC